MSAQVERTTAAGRDHLKDLRNMPTPRRSRAEQAAVATSICLLLSRVGSPAWHQYASELWVITAEFAADEGNIWQDLSTIIWRMRTANSQVSKSEQTQLLRKLIIPLYRARCEVAQEAWQANLPDGYARRDQPDVAAGDDDVLESGE